ncbi:ankyrin repeat domain-containing protein [Croceibacterium sp. TMG7-5b_MA50]|uniref:ankyrin repeat domain-containing protein n=1 Tax=Croceibacterium sp. TMG7-5b_MA50 TaxID=3121290 RepID=UPI003221CE2C
MRAVNRVAMVTRGVLATALLVPGGVALTSLPAAAQNYSPGYQFLEAVKKKDGTKVIEMLAGPGGSTIINSRDITDGHNALHIAVDRRDVTWINFLTARGANANMANNRGVTPLLRAVQIGFDEGVAALVRAGARVDEQNTAGETPLMSAVHQRDTGLMRTLLQAGADPDRVDNSGRSARDYAELDGNNSVTLAEIERSAKPPEEREGARASYGPSF